MTNLLNAGSPVLKKRDQSEFKHVSQRGWPYLNFCTLLIVTFVSKKLSNFPAQKQGDKVIKPHR